MSPDLTLHRLTMIRERLQAEAAGSDKELSTFNHRDSSIRLGRAGQQTQYCKIPNGFYCMSVQADGDGASDQNVSSRTVSSLRRSDKTGERRSALRYLPGLRHQAGRTRTTRSLCATVDHDDWLSEMDYECLLACHLYHTSRLSRLISLLPSEQPLCDSPRWRHLKGYRPLLLNSE